MQNGLLERRQGVHNVEHSVDAFIGFRAFFRLYGLQAAYCRVWHGMAQAVDSYVPSNDGSDGHERQIEFGMYLPQSQHCILHNVFRLIAVLQIAQGDADEFRSRGGGFLLKLCFGHSQAVWSCF